MIGLDTLNTRVIANSLNQTVQKPEFRSSVAEDVTPEKSEKTKSYVSAMKGATILAGVVFAGIMIARNKSNIAKLFKNNVKPELPDTKIIPETLNKSSYDVDKRSNDVFESENLKERISNKYNQVIEITHDAVERQAQRVKRLVNPEDKPVPFDDRLFTSHQAEMVSSHLENDVLNELLRRGKITPEKNIEIRTLNELIEDAPPLKENAVVYKGILTQNKGQTLDIARQLYSGNTIEDKGFVLTSRNAAETIRDMGEKSGYVARISLCEGTQGIDCRRFTTLDLDTGTNASFILPAGSKFRINAVDESFKIIDADYLLQK